MYNLKNNTFDFRLDDWITVKVRLSISSWQARTHPMRQASCSMSIRQNWYDLLWFFETQYWILQNRSSHLNNRAKSRGYLGSAVFNVSNFLRLVAPPWLIPRENFWIFDKNTPWTTTYLNKWLYEFIFPIMSTTNNLSNNREIIELRTLFAHLF